jgi:DNA-binding transcriptional ArsR family regulator
VRSLPVLNAVGDLVLTDHPAAMRVLAAPLSLSLHDELRRGGPATADELASRIQADPDTTQERLRQLEAVGLVTSGEPVADREQARWQACGKGVFFEIPDDPDGAAAARLLSNAMILRYVDLPTRWVAEHEPQLSLDWARAAGLFNAGVTLTPGELRDIQDGLEQLLEPFLNRDAADVPADARRVRILSYFMPSLS